MPMDNTSEVRGKLFPRRQTQRRGPVVEPQPLEGRRCLQHGVCGSGLPSRSFLVDLCSGNQEADRATGQSK